MSFKIKKIVIYKLNLIEFFTLMNTSAILSSKLLISLEDVVICAFKIN